jgi:hypothetical protein
VQTKLAVGPANDRCEQEPDRVAERGKSILAQVRTSAFAQTTSGAVQPMPLADGLTSVDAQRQAEEEEPSTAATTSTTTV